MNTRSINNCIHKMYSNELISGICVKFVSKPYTHKQETYQFHAH